MIDPPGEHPEPPADLDSRSPLVFTIPVGTSLFRLHHRSKGPLFFGRTGRNRFDAPDGGFGVLYAALDEHCAFIETFGQSTGIRIVTRAELEQRVLSEMKVMRPLTVIDLARSGGLARVGADGRLLTGSHAIAQRWSAALHNLSSKPAGILYPARHDVARFACAFFDLPDSAFQITNTGSMLEPHHSVLLARILDTYGFGFID
jgi:RES domain-containing protein